MAERLKLNIPSSSYRRPGEPRDVKPTDRSLEAFRRKIELLQLAQKAKNKVKAEKKKTERLAERQSWSHSLKRVQRYLGLRETRVGPAPKKYQLSSDWSIPTMIDQLPPTSFAPDKLAPFPFEGHAVFISVDIEAYEKDHNKITEIGISTLDTKDLAKICPGKDGINWRDGNEVIRARHFRISDYKHLNNSEFIDGCADRFEFGKSEFISLAEAPSVVASCFKYPFSKVGAPVEENETKRNIILVGHDVMQDVNYLRKIGYDVYNLSNLMEQVDTASMWRYLTRDPNPRNLGSILADLGIVGWNLHNAGNDAAYTLQAMVGIAIKAIVDKTKSREVLEAEKMKRVSSVAAEAQATALEREEEWGSNAESDGGKPIKPAPTPKVVPVAPQPSKQISQIKKPIDKDNGPWGTGPWEHKPAVPGTNSWTQDDSAEKGGWRKPSGSKNIPAWDSAGWGLSATKKNAYASPSGQLNTKPSNVHEDSSYTRGGSRYSPAYGGENRGAPGNGDRGQGINQAAENYQEAPAWVTRGPAQEGENLSGYLPPHLRSAAGKQVKQEAKPEIKEEPLQEVDGWGYPIPSQATQSHNEIPAPPTTQTWASVQVGGNSMLPPHLRAASKQVKEEARQEVKQEPVQEEVDGWGYPLPSHATQNYNEVPTPATAQTWGSQGVNSYDNLPAHLESAAGNQVEKDAKEEEIQQELVEDVDGWGYYLPKQASKQVKPQLALEEDGWGSFPPQMPIPARAATPPVKQEHYEDLYEADSPRFEDEIPAGYSPGRRNNPIGEAIRSNPGSATNFRAGGTSQTKQPLSRLVGTAKITPLPSGYRPSSGNPVGFMLDAERFDQHFGSGGNEQAGVEDEFRSMNLDGKANGGHADAW